MYITISLSVDLTISPIERLDISSLTAPSIIFDDGKEKIITITIKNEGFYTETYDLSYIYSPTFVYDIEGLNTIEILPNNEEKMEIKIRPLEKIPREGGSQFNIEVSNNNENKIFTYLFSYLEPTIEISEVACDRYALLEGQSLKCTTILTNTGYYSSDLTFLISSDEVIIEEVKIDSLDYLETWTDLCPEEESLPWDSDGDGCIDDSDGDSVEDPNDVCWGFDDAIDVDNDSIPDGCDSFIDSDSDGVADSIDLCPGFDDALDVDNDSIPDDCDVLLDNDSDGIANSDDMCEGFDDSLDADEDGIPDGCDTQVDDQQNSSQDSETETGNNSATNTNNLITDNGNLSNSNQDDSLLQEINQSENGTEFSSDTEPKSSEMSMTPKLIMSLLLIGTGIWLLLYLCLLYTSPSPRD